MQMQRNADASGDEYVMVPLQAEMQVHICPKTQMLVEIMKGAVGDHIRQTILKREK